MRALWLVGVLFAVGCEFETLADWSPEGVATCDERDVNIQSNPKSCGACPPVGEVCAEGVACVDYWCDYTSVMHCGAAYRACDSAGSMGCVKVEGGEQGLAIVGAVVNGYACVALGEGDAGGDGGVGSDAGGEVMEPVAEDDPRGEGEGGASGVAYGRPSWLFVPSASDECHGGDPVRCHHVEVDFVDVCGGRCWVPFTHNFSMMTTEMSRAHYREAVCDCNRLRSEECADVCTHRGPEVDALPMTGLNWCMAQAACEAVGGRLPTNAELARFEQYIGEKYGVGGDLFHGGSCSSWASTAGSAPRVGECLDRGAEAELTRVDDPRGAVVIETLGGPVAVHHLLGNVEEWKLDEPAAARCIQVLSEHPVRVPRGMEGLRTMQGRSVASPMGDRVNSIATLAPSTRAPDLGVRCAQSRVAPAGLEEAMRAKGAVCEPDTPVGRSPVRLISGERLYRAVEAQVVSRAPYGPGWERLLPFADALASNTTPLVWRDVELDQIGQAWFSPDAQWWIGVPGRLGEVFTLEVFRNSPLELAWTAMSDEASGTVMDEMTAAYADQDGFIAHRFDFIIERSQLRFGFPSALNRPQLACAHLECVDSVAQDACETRCPAWRLTVVLGFEQVVPFAGNPEVCQ
jgi:hypothetical protein